MDHSNVSDLVKRLDHLEQRNRRLTKGGICFFVFFLGIFLLGALSPDPRIIEAEKFILKDASGKQRAVLQVTEKEGPGMIFYDANEKPRIFLGLFCLACDNFSALAFHDEKGEVYAELVTDKKGRSYLSFRGADGLSHELLGIDTNGTLFLAPTDKTSKVLRRKAS